VSRLITAAADRADSAAERVLKGLLREAGIAGWVLGHRFGPHLIDLAFPEQRVAVEVDGCLARRRRPLPHRPAQGERAHPRRLDGAAIHLARPGHATCRGHRGDPAHHRGGGVIARNGVSATDLSP
jgi:hypothetical protein